MAWAYLAIAVLTEIVGTLGLRRVADHPEWWSVALILAAYMVSFTFMTVALRTLNVGVVYAIWSAVGTAAVSIAGAALFGDKLNPTAVVGLVVIVAGVVILVGSGSAHHA